MKKNRLALLMQIIAAFSLLTSCQNDEPTQKTNYPDGPAYSMMDSRGVDAILTFNTPFLNAEIARWNNEKIYNNVVSPLSAAYVAALMANGTDENGREKILRAFGLEPSEIDLLNTTIWSITTSINHKVAGSQISTANSAWAHCNENLSIKFTEHFSNQIKKYYDAKIGYANLISNYPESQHPINKWASDFIGEKISFFSPSDNSYLVLANIILFEADWKQEFEEKRTKKEKFHNFDASIASVDFLHGKQDIRYLPTNEGEFISMKYDNFNISMNIFIPADGENVEYNFGIFDIAYDTERWLYGNTELQMPKFKFDVRNKLYETFQLMDIADSFAAADGFSNMVEVSDPDIRLNSLLEIEQTLKMSVNEKGTKVVAITSAMPEYTEPLSQVPEQIKIDRPFLFEIVAYNQIIAAGRIMKL